MARSTVSDTKPWYVGEPLTGLGWPVKAATFFADDGGPTPDDGDHVRALCDRKDTAEEIAQTHNDQPWVKRNTDAVLAQIERERAARKAHAAEVIREHGWIQDDPPGLSGGSCRR